MTTDWGWLWIFKRSSPHGQHERTPQNHQTMQCHVTHSKQPRSIWAGGCSQLYLCVHSCVLRSYCSSSAIRCAIQKRIKLLSIVGELAGTYREPSQHFRGLYLQLADTISSQLHTVADVRRHLIQRYVTAVPRPTTLQITLWIKRKSLFWTSRFKTRNSQRTGNWRLQYRH